MLDDSVAFRKFFVRLADVDQQFAQQTAQRGCVHCGGRLDRADFPRKPRTAGLIPDEAIPSRRISFCCAREGCRKRATPWSALFLDRKIYLAPIIVLACAWIQLQLHLHAAVAVSQRTLRRWLTWWNSQFISSAFWTLARARLALPLLAHALPGSLWECFGSPSLDTLESMLKFIAPSRGTSMRSIAAQPRAG
jgi:hypothetical protein